MKVNKTLTRGFELLRDNGLKISFLVALIAMSGSLFYSDVAGYNPCKMCWFQRIFMYPLVPIFGLAIGKKDKNIHEYGVVMSVIGGAIAAYHYLLQRGLVRELSCSVVGYSASCSDNFGMTFGYITIPMMAFSAFLLIALLMFVALMPKKS